MERCIGLLGRIFGHKFRARFNRAALGDITKNLFAMMPWQRTVEALNAHAEQTYQCDVCERCGAVVDRFAKGGIR